MIGELLFKIGSVRRILQQKIDDSIRAAVEPERALRIAADQAARERFDVLEALLEHPQILAVSALPSPLPSPAVSVIMPSHNRAGIVGAAIRSVIAQSFGDWELLVIDDGSRDDTASVVADFTRADARIHYHHKANAGLSAARNTGLGLARGALLAYLDDDNLWYPGFLAAMAALFAEKPEVDCAYGATMTDVHRADRRLLFDPFDRQRLLHGNFIDMGCFVHRRQLVERYGGFDEQLRNLEDWDLILRYTADKAPWRLPVLAQRYRVLDKQRVTETRSYDEAAAHIRAKWAPLAPEADHAPGSP